AAGDVGTGGAAEKRTAEVMDSLETDGEFAALLLLGDNVDPSGSASALQTNVLDPFAGVLDGPTELVAALGNHDVQTADGEPQVEALGLPGRWYTETYGPVKIVVVDSTRAADPDQLAWIQTELDAPTDATWTVVIQHHPPFSAGYHGSHQTSRDNLVPIYEAAGVDLVLAGHDHDYQHIEPQNGVTYVVSGAAAKLRKTARADFTIEAASTHSFLELDAYADELVIRSVDHDGRLIDSFALPAPR
ncbi:MAG: metallophosphoesterase, partial [Acidimicrobiales bacterium]|nr:metallophosphoesterase [Acidimicrobiales bacterium]